MIAFSETTPSGPSGPERIECDTDWIWVRRTMIAQTEAFIAEGLKHPEFSAVIPTIPAGEGCFPKNWSLYFWQRILGAT